MNGALVELQADQGGLPGFERLTLVKDKAEISQQTTPLSQFSSRRHGVSVFTDRTASFVEGVLDKILTPHLSLHPMFLSGEYRKFKLKRRDETYPQWKTLPRRKELNYRTACLTTKLIS